MGVAAGCVRSRSMRSDRGRGHGDFTKAAARALALCPVAPRAHTPCMIHGFLASKTACMDDASKGWEVMYE